MSAQLGTTETVSEINMTPLIDIVLVVLIIMMVSMPIKIQKMGVKLPGDSEVKVQNELPTEQLVIALYPKRDSADPHFPMALNLTLMPENVLLYQLSAKLRNMSKKNVFVDAHPDIPYGDVVEVMDLARQAGAAKVGLAKLKERGPSAPTAVAPGSLPKGVSIGNPTTVGALSAAKADQAVQPFKGHFMQCYEQGLAASRDLSGLVILRVAVGPEGEIMSHKVASSNLNAPPVEDCLLNLLPSLQFEPLGEGLTAVVQYRLLFSPG